MDWNFDLSVNILQVMADNPETRKDVIKGKVSSWNNTNWNEIYAKLLVKVNQVSLRIRYIVVWETVNSSSNLSLQLKYHIISIHFSSLVEYVIITALGIVGSLTKVSVHLNKYTHTRCSPFLEVLLHDSDILLAGAVWWSIWITCPSFLLGIGICDGFMWWNVAEG